MINNRKTYTKIFTVCAFVVANFFIWTGGSVSGRGVLTVAFLDVGQGDAIFIEAPNGNQLLVDGGPGKNILQKLSGYMPYFDREIDIVVATHPDKDHIGGLPAVFEKYEVKYLLDSGVSSETGIFASYEEIIQEKNIKRMTAVSGMVLDMGDGVMVEVLHPDQDETFKDTNDASVILRIVYGETEIMLTGDASKNIERKLVLSGMNIQSDILKAGHHGSKTSTLDLFVEKVSPSLAIISAGKNNSYGHPSPEVLDTLKSFNVEILETSKEGDIVFIFDGKNFQRKNPL